MRPVLEVSRYVYCIYIRDLEFWLFVLLYLLSTHVIITERVVAFQMGKFFLLVNTTFDIMVRLCLKVILLE